jgi:2-dehydropantoate 2-reductase
MNKQNPKVVFLGTGAIGAGVTGWVAPHYSNLFAIDRGPVQAALKKSGITTYLGGEPDKKENAKVNVIDDLSGQKDADVVVITVKNYDLDAAAKMVRDKLGDNPVVVSMANGAINQKIMPKYFSKVVYGVISYNAWMDEPVVVGYQKKGPLVLGTPDNKLQEEMKVIADIFNRGVETIVTDHLQDAVHSKIVINLANSLTTLTGPDHDATGDFPLFQRLLTSMVWEGIEIVKANGYKECRLGGMPGWTVLMLAAKLPGFLMRPVFRANVKKMVMSSMAQDVVQRKSGKNELDTINGYILELAEKAGVKAPYNRAIYELCKKRFAEPQFKTMTAGEIWKEVAKALKV